VSCDCVVLSWSCVVVSSLALSCDSLTLVLVSVLSCLFLAYPFSGHRLSELPGYPVYTTFPPNEVALTCLRVRVRVRVRVRSGLGLG
jgi:hypothetical protein